MGVPQRGEHELSRRGFLGWGAGLLSAVVLPAGAIVLTEDPAAAASMSAYALSTWLALNQRTVQASAPGRSSTALTVVKVTDLAGAGTTATTTKMTGDVFAVVLRASSRLPSQIYTVTAANLGSVMLFVEGVNATTARVLINRRLPAKA